MPRQTEQADVHTLETQKLAQSLSSLPVSVLQKLAFGDDTEWLEKYRGTPLFPQAIELMKADLQAEIQRAQQAEARAAQFKDEDSWRASQQISLQKKMLDLQLIELQQQADAAEGVQEQQGAGALGPPVATELPQDLGAVADKQASDAYVAKLAMAAAPALVKIAADVGMLSKAFNLAKANPSLTAAAGGAVTGGLAGAMSDARDEQGRPKGLLGRVAGGALKGGALAGGAAAGAGVLRDMHGGKTLGEVMKGHKEKLQGIWSSAKPAAQQELFK